MSELVEEVRKTIFTDEIKTTQITTTLGGNKMTKMSIAKQQLEQVAGKVAVNQYSPYGVIVAVTKRDIHVGHSIFGMFGSNINGEEVIYQKSLGEWLEDKYFEPEDTSTLTGFSKNEIEVVRLWAGYDYDGGKEALSQEMRSELLDEFYKETVAKAFEITHS